MSFVRTRVGLLHREVRNYSWKHMHCIRTMYLTVNKFLDSNQSLFPVNTDSPLLTVHNPQGLIRSEASDMQSQCESFEIRTKREGRCIYAAHDGIDVENLLLGIPYDA